MEISLTDKFKTKEELIEAINLYGENNNIKWEMQETPRTLVFMCNGKHEFNCDATIVTSYKKKDKCWGIKRMKLVHKCLVANDEYTSKDEFLRNEILNNIENVDTLRIGDIVQILYNRSIRVSFSTVYNIINGISNNRMDTSNRIIDKIDVEPYINSNNNIPKVNNDKLQNSGLIPSTQIESAFSYTTNNKETCYEYCNSDMVNLSYMTENALKKFHNEDDVINEFCKEIKILNEDRIRVCFYGKMIFYKCVEYYNILFNIPEIKYYKKNNGIVFYSLLYDPYQEPIIYTCCISEEVDDTTTFKYFLQNTQADAYLVEYDLFLIKILDLLQIKYFVKTRDVCKKVFSIDSDRGNIETVWNICNEMFFKQEDEKNEKENIGNSQIENEKENIGITSDLKNTKTEVNTKENIGITSDLKNTKTEKILEILNLQKDKFIKTEFPFKLLNFNNLPECDIDFINYSCYNLPLLECLNSICKLSMDNLRLKKKLASDTQTGLFGYNVVNRIERNLVSAVTDNHVVDITKEECTCGMYQELLIPCVHACKYMKENRLDPYLYVSVLYSKNQYSRLKEIRPVINIRLQPDRVNYKKGPGRPRKA